MGRGSEALPALFYTQCIRYLLMFSLSVFVMGISLFLMYILVSFSAQFVHFPCNSNNIDAPYLLLFFLFSRAMGFIPFQSVFAFILEGFL